MTESVANKRSSCARVLGKYGGSKGGIMASRRLTPAQRKARARKAALARWDKVHAKIHGQIIKDAISALAAPSKKKKAK